MHEGMQGELSLTALERSVRGYISEKRFLHTLGVRDTALKLCDIYGCSKEKAEIASLLHDAARDIPVESMRKLLKERGVWSEEYEPISRNPLLLHAPAGRVIASSDFGIEDEELLRSIELHTTGGNCMQLLEKVIFVADFIEPGRSFRGVETARRLSSRSLDETIFYIYKFTLRNLLMRELFICKNTLLGYNEVVLRLNR
jgi:predicted HD superfamily hydrolase involved in NAD metabolism